MQKRVPGRWTVADTVLTVVVAAVALIIWGVLLFGVGRGETVRVTVDGQTVARYSLDRDRTTVIDGADGGKNTLVIKDGQATVTDATCPDKICQHHHPISRPGESIICLPNRVVVTVEGTNRQIDAVA